VADQIAELAGEYSIGTLHGDNFSGDTWASMFRKRGLSYVVEKRTASALYRAGAPVITSKRAELPDPKTGFTALRAINQLTNLEKREGGEKITHPQGANTTTSPTR
jgi:hypothetical protein